MNVISLEGVAPEVLGRWALGGGVEFRRGGRYLIESASGGGKSSLCSFLCGIRGDYNGTIRFDGRDIRELDRRGWCEIRRGAMGLMMQDLRLFPELTAAENVMLKSSLTRVFGLSEVASLFERLGIGDKMGEPVDRLSFGQQQRVAFVRMLCQEADFFVMDEPVSHLDDANSAVMADILREHADRLGAGAIVTSIGKHFDMEWDKTFAL